MDLPLLPIRLRTLFIALVNVIIPPETYRDLGIFLLLLRRRVALAPIPNLVFPFIMHAIANAADFSPKLASFER